LPPICIPDGDGIGGFTAYGVVGVGCDVAVLGGVSSNVGWGWFEVLAHTTIVAICPNFAT